MAYVDRLISRNGSLIMEKDTWVLSLRVGNRAFNQTQHDVFGELFNTAYELLRNGATLDSNVMDFLSQ